MDCSHVAEHQVADRYVLAQLTPAEAESFEDHYMTCPDCLAELERAEVMVRGFKRAAADAADGALVEAATDFTRGSDDATPRRADTSIEDRSIDNVVAGPVSWWRRSTVWMPAAAALLIAATGLLFVRPPTDAGPAVDAAAAIAFLQPERSSEAVPSHQLRVRPGDGPVVLVLEIAPPTTPASNRDAPRYRARLERGDDPLWEGDGLTPGERDSLALSLDSRLLTPGDYLLRLDEEDGGSAGHFAFRVLPVSDP